MRLAVLAVLAAFQSAPAPATSLARIIKAYLVDATSDDWDALDQLAGIKWAPLPAKSLEHCLPDGGCFIRQGTAALGGRNLVVIATGARSIVSTLYFRNAAAPVGEGALVAALGSPELARCPVQGKGGSTSWYRTKGGFVAIQTVRGAKPSEGFTVSRGEDLPRLQPNQVALYSEQCGAGAERKPVSTAKPHEVLAEKVVALLAPASGAALYDWNALKAAAGEVEWNPGPGKGSLTGRASFGGRTFSVQGIGSATQVKAVNLEEQGLHPRGEHMLGVVYEKGITVRLVRCGPVYTESTNNWYSLVSAKTRPAMIRQSIRYDGNNVQDSYELRLDGTLPPRDPRDREPGVNDCR